MNEPTKVTNKNLEAIYGEKSNLDRYLREYEREEQQQKIKYVLDLLRNNPDLTEDMVRPDLRKYLGIAKREYKKELIQAEFTNNCINKRR